MIVFPEGGTTNGTCLIKFAKGAFTGLHNIQPMGISYKAALTNVGNGVLPFISHFMIVTGNPYVFANMQVLPVFKPNEYFWKNHQQEGEEKW